MTKLESQNTSEYGETVRQIETVAARLYVIIIVPVPEVKVEGEG